MKGEKERRGKRKRRERERKRERRGEREVFFFASRRSSGSFSSSSSSSSFASSSLLSPVAFSSAARSSATVEPSRANVHPPGTATRALGIALLARREREKEREAFLSSKSRRVRNGKNLFFSLSFSSVCSLFFLSFRAQRFTFLKLCVSDHAVKGERRRGRGREGSACF